MNSDIAALYKQLKIEKSNKGEIASKFKFTDKASDDYQTLLKAMQDISGRIKDIETHIKELESNSTIETNNNSVDTITSPFELIDTEKNWSEAFTYKILTTVEFQQWDSFLKKQSASGYHHSAWLNVIKKSFGHDSKVLVALDNNKNILGGIPLTFFSSKIFGTFAVSVPFVNYGGVVSNYFNIAKSLIQKAQTLCDEQHLSHIEIRTMQEGLADNSLDKKVSMVLELPSTDEALEKQLGAKVRAQYKKAEEHVPTYKVGKLDLLDDFYNVFARNMRDLGTPVYSKNWFKDILCTPEIKSSILVVYMNRKPVSTGFLVGNNTTLEIPWASTIQSANGKNANMWMYRHILSYAIAEGYKFFDFGRSTMGAGTFKFKKQWGAKPYQHHWYYLLANETEKPELNPDNPKFKIFIFMWKLMPIWLTKIIGPHIIKNIP